MRIRHPMVIIGVLTCLYFGISLNISPSVNAQFGYRSTSAINHKLATTMVQPHEQKEEGHVIGNVIISGSRAAHLYKYVPAAGTAFADTINTLQEKLAHHLNVDVPVTVLLAPTAVEFFDSPQAKSLSSSQEHAIEAVYQQINSNVTKVNVLPYLREHASEYLFFRTDHHWTQTAAYYAYQAFMNIHGETTYSLSSYRIRKIDGFLGSLYSSTLNNKLKSHPDTVVLYEPFTDHKYVVHYKGPLHVNLLDLSQANKKNKYRIFLSGDRPWGKITTDADNHRRIAVIKDSFGNAFIPFLLPHFKEIYVIDPRHFDQPLIEFIDQHCINEVLVLTNTTITTYTGFTSLIRKLL